MTKGLLFPLAAGDDVGPRPVRQLLFFGSKNDKAYEKQFSKTYSRVNNISAEKISKSGEIQMDNVVVALCINVEAAGNQWRAQFCFRTLEIECFLLTMGAPPAHA